MMLSSPVSDLISPKTNTHINKYTYISAYSMGKIGIKKIIENPFKTPVIHYNNKFLVQSFPINSITNNTNNNTNTNTNSNTNINTSKNQDIQTSKKKVKNSFSVSPNNIIPHSQSNSNYKYYYKNKTSQRINIIKKNNQQSSLSPLKFIKRDFSKTENNLYKYTNFYNNSKYKINKSYSNNKNKSNSNKKLMNERKLTDRQMKSHSYHSSCIFSSMKPSLLKKGKNPNSMTNIIINNTKEKNNNSSKSDISEIYFKNSNLSITDINPNKIHSILNEENKDNNNLDFKYQMTESNINYLRVRRRPEFQNYLNNNNKDIIKNNSTQKKNIEIKPLKINTPPSSSLLFTDKYKIYKNDNNKEINKDIYNLTERNLEYINYSNEECFNINKKESNNISKINLKDSKNLTYLNQEKNTDKKGNKNSYNNDHFNINIINNKKRELELNNKKKERNNNFTQNKTKNNNSKNKKIDKSNNNNYLNNKYKKQYKIENFKFYKSNSNDNAFIKYKNNKNNSNKNDKNVKNNITNMKDLKKEENIRNINIYNNTRNIYSSSYSKTKYKNKTKKNYSLSNNKNKTISKDKNNKDIQIKSNHNNNENKNYNNEIIDLNKISNDNIINEENKRDEIHFESPEELHYFIVELNQNFRYLAENY